MTSLPNSSSVRPAPTEGGAFTRFRRKARLAFHLGPFRFVLVFLYACLRKLTSVFPPWVRESHELIETLHGGDATLESVAGGLAVEYQTALAGRVRCNLRPSTTDVLVWQDVIVREQYGPVVRIVRESTGLEPRTIIDAGANCGLASLYLAHCFPHARVLALEPDPANFAALTGNVRLATRIDPLCAAFWPRPEFLALDGSFRDSREWSRRVRAQASPEGPSLSVVTPGNALERLRTPRCDILKMDIEGGEAPFFADEATARALLEAARVVAIEVHPEFVDPTVVYAALHACGFCTRTAGELVIGVHESILLDAHRSGLSIERVT